MDQQEGKFQHQIIIGKQDFFDLKNNIYYIIIKKYVMDQKSGIKTINAITTLTVEYDDIDKLIFNRSDQLDKKILEELKNGIKENKFTKGTFTSTVSILPDEELGFSLDTTF